MCTDVPKAKLRLDLDVYLHTSVAFVFAALQEGVLAGDDRAAGRRQTEGDVGVFAGRGKGTSYALGFFYFLRAPIYILRILIEV